MKEAGTYELEDFEEKFQEISKIIYSSKDTDPVDMSDLKDSIKAIEEFLKSSGRMQRPLYNPTLLILNDIFDAFPDQVLSSGALRW